ncbi:MAG TPA: helix-turn-helix transcriptional regulator [Marmoricola sp.]|nr:helix-turn-helix transcriptional regulator [Marmoricola sp.]
MVANSGVAAPLGVLGLTAEQHNLYRVLLRNSGEGLEVLAQRLGRPVAALRDDLAALLAVGLVELHDDVVVADAPDRALGRLISEETRRLQSMTDQLQSVRGMLPSLMADHLSAQAPSGEPVTVEVVDGGDVAGLIRSLSVASTGDLMWLRPDQWRLEAGREVDDWVKDLSRSGRRSRALYPARVLAEAPEVVRARAEAGEHVRVLASIPCRVAIMGTSAALIPEHWGRNSGRRLVVRQDAMIGALTMLFDSLWDRAMAVPGLDGRLDGAERSDSRRLLLDQLAGGAKDEQIARALGLSLRTVRRRVADILEELGVESRFQAGVEAVRRGWL